VPACRPVAQHDQRRRNKTVTQHLGIAPFGRVIQPLQASVCRNSQACQRQRLPPAPRTQADHGCPQSQPNANGQGSKPDGAQRQRHHDQQQQPQPA